MRGHPGHKLQIRRIARNSQWGRCFGVLGAEPPAAGGQWWSGGEGPSCRRLGVRGQSPQPPETRGCGAEPPALKNFAFFCENNLILELFFCKNNLILAPPPPPWLRYCYKYITQTNTNLLKIRPWCPTTTTKHKFEINGRILAI